MAADDQRDHMNEQGRDPMDGQSRDHIDELSESLVRASWRLRRNERKELTAYGLTFAQARVLRLLISVPDGMRVGELADALEIVPRSATGMVDGLESAGLVTRRMDPADRRSVLVSCSERGRHLLDRLAAERRAAGEGLFSPLSSEDKRRLLKLLQSITGER